MKARRCSWIVAALLAACWAGYALLGAKLSQMVAARFGAALLRFGQGKFNDPAWFVQNRLREALWLATIFCACLAVQALVAHGLVTRMKTARWRWTLRGTSGFVLLNVWVGLAAQTAIFWAALGLGVGVENYLQFQFKRIIAAEIRAPAQAVLVGSSQTRSQIDENVLNEQLGSQLWTTELHYPGSTAYDLLLIEPVLQRLRPQFVICYLSERYFYTGTETEVAKNFFTFSQLPDFSRRGAARFISAERVAYGLLGDLLPVFQCREALSRRFLGQAVMNLQQAAHDSSLAVDLDARAAETAKTFTMTDSAAFQKQAFEDFVSRCEAGGMRVVLLAGGMNPLLLPHFNPAIRADMTQFLHDLQQRHPTLVVTENLPAQTPADYEDLSHVNLEAQTRFSLYLVGFLKDLLPSGQ